MNSLKPRLLFAVALLILTAGFAAAQTEPEDPPMPTDEPTRTAAPGLIEEETVDYTRQGFHFALNLGVGGAEARFGVPNHPEIDQERELGAAVDARLGWAPNEWLLVGACGTAWLKTYNLIDGDSRQELPADVSYSIAGGFVQAFFFGDFYVRAMAGAGFTHINPRDEDAIDESGLGYSVGLGWEARLTDTLALTPLVQYSRIMIDNVDVPDGNEGIAPVDPSAIFVNASLGLIWYF